MDIRDIREKTGLSRTAFAKRYGIPLRTVEDWEAGKRTPPEYVVRLLSEAVERDAALREHRDDLILINRTDLGEGFSSELYRSGKYEVSVISSPGTVTVKASPLKSWLPEIHLHNGNVTKIGFVGDVILEENLTSCAEGLNYAHDTIKLLKDRFCGC